MILLPQGAIGWFLICDCDYIWSQLLVCLLTFAIGSGPSESATYFLFFRGRRLEPEVAGSCEQERHILISIT